MRQELKIELEKMLDVPAINAEMIRRQAQAIVEGDLSIQVRLSCWRLFRLPMCLWRRLCFSEWPKGLSGGHRSSKKRDSTAGT